MLLDNGRALAAVIQLSDVATGIGGFALDGEAASDRSGESVSMAGDVDGDGVTDIIVGAPDSDVTDFGSGRAYVVFGVRTLPD